jgi:hypothetical protein
MHVIGKYWGVIGYVADVVIKTAVRRHADACSWMSFCARELVVEKNGI